MTAATGSDPRNPGPMFEAFDSHVVQRISDQQFFFHGYRWQGADGVIDVAHIEFGDRKAPRGPEARGSVRMWKGYFGSAEVKPTPLDAMAAHLHSVLSIDNRYANAVSGMSLPAFAEVVGRLLWLPQTVTIDGDSVLGSGARYESLKVLTLGYSDSIVTVVGSDQFVNGPYEVADTASHR